MMQDPKAHGPALFRLCKLMRMQQHPLLSAVESAERNAALLCKAFLIKSRTMISKLVIVMTQARLSPTQLVVVGQALHPASTKKLFKRSPIRQQPC